MIFKKTFKGGIHLNEHKNTAGAEIDLGFSPDKVTIPMQQHIGAPCSCIVKKGDTVKRGQLIGEPAANLSCAVHSSVSGTVADVCELISIGGQKVVHVIIENDKENTNDDSVVPKDYTKMSPDEITEAIKQSGISGMGGATFPTYAKIKSAVGKVDTLIVNCSECEPYITANHRLMVERPDEMLGGIRILLKALSLPLAKIAIADNKPDAIGILKKKTSGCKDIKVEVVKTKYPQGDERQLIFAITGRQIPTGKLPADVGCVVFNAETTEAVYNYFAKGEPLIEKIVTVDGDCVVSPKCVLAPIGTSYEDLIAYCGGTTAEPKKIVSGGPMMGFSVWTEKTPVSKGCSSVLVFANSEDQAPTENNSCIRCGKCVKACPMHLMPSYIANYARKDLLSECDKLGARSCVECGSCSYVCPAKIPVSQYVRTAKAKINAKARRAK